MTPERWQQVAGLFESALEHAPANRAAFLASACGDDVTLRAEIESLLQQESTSAVADDLPGRVAADMFSSPGLVAGTFLGAYRIIAPLGAGGMGEVYHAYDTRLNREVALKILPAEFVDDPDRLARFTRESHVLASLNHPNIAAIYGSVDGSPSNSGTLRPEALVLELVTGPTLADRITGGRVALDEALAIARQTAEALRAAHDSGVIHRDLKPANIKVRDDGTVKVLDFGLATRAAAHSASPQAGRPETLQQSVAVVAPTMTRPGGVVGTPAYMSPEQAEGRTADKASDVWAFGCVLFEMLTGERAFTVGSVSHTVPTGPRDEPHWQALRSDLPTSIHTLLRRCLERDRKRRIADASTILFLIDEAATPTGPVLSGNRDRSIGKSIAWFTATAACAAAIASAGWWLARPTVAPSQVTRFTIALPADQRFANDTRSMMAISRDGSQLAYFASGRLHAHAMSTGASHPIVGSEIGAGVANNLSFSPDGRWIAYWDSSDRHLKKISISGGSPVMLASTFNPVGVSWDDSGILLADPMSGELVRLGADGGTREVLVRAKEDEIVWSPQMLPDGEHVLFSVGDRTAGRSASPDVVVQSVRSGERHVVIPGGNAARFVRTGHILFFSDGGLFGVPFDERRLETAGERIPLIDDVIGGFPAFDVSDTGSLIYIAGDSRTGGLAMIERHGGVTSLPVKAAAYEAPRISPDGTRVAVGTAGTQADIWIADLRGTSSIRQLTLEGRNRFPVWSGDGKRIAFQSDRGGDVAIWSQRVDGTQPAERLTTPTANSVHTPEAWSPRENSLLYDSAGASQHALWTLSLDDRRSKIVSDVHGSGVPIAATFSPDGRWIAYQFGSVGPGTFPSVFVRPFPLTTVKYRIADGIHPLWSPDGKELLYNQGPSRPLAAVSVTTAPIFAWSEPRSELLAIASLEGGLWFERNIDIAPDGRLIGVVAAHASAPQKPAPTQIQVVLNWFEELNRLVPRSR